MNKRLWMLAILICGSLFLVGCDDDDDDDGGSTAGGTSTTGTSGGTSGGDTSSDSTSGGDAATPAPDANAAFQAISPSNLRLVDQYDVAGRGTVYTVACNEIPGAAAYVFTCFGTTENVGVPQASFLKAGPREPFEWNVFAINSAGYNTQTASGITSP